MDNLVEGFHHNAATGGNGLFPIFRHQFQGAAVGVHAVVRPVHVSGEGVGVAYHVPARFLQIDLMALCRFRIAFLFPAIFQSCFHAAGVENAIAVVDVGFITTFLFAVFPNGSVVAHLVEVVYGRGGWVVT